MSPYPTRAHRGRPTPSRPRFRPSVETMESRRLLSGSADVLTYHNDNSRTGQNLNETLLTPANVNPSQFGKLFTDPVDGYVYGQPLYMANVSIPGQGTHNVVFVVTENDSVYAFDADHPGPALWHDNLADPAAGVIPIPANNLDAAPDIGPLIGITSTPVIDPSSGTIYVIAATMHVSGSGITYEDQIHALDIGTGAEKFGGPETIHFVTRGRGTGHVKGGKIPFQAIYQLQRSALLLLNGEVYAAWASFNDAGPYHGLVVGFNAQTLQPESYFNATPNGRQGGIWMGGGGLAADAAGSIYLATGNGTFDASSGGRDYGDSLVKLASGPGPLRVLDYYTPKNQAVLGANDFDYGSGGVLLPPAQPGSSLQIALTGGKDGILDVVNRNHMGHLGGRKGGLLETLPQTKNHPLFSTPAYYNGEIYVQFVGAPLEAFGLVNGVPTRAPISTASTPFGYAGATPTISANGSTNGIVWVVQHADLNGPTSQAVLYAYNAANLSDMLYNSSEAGTRDQTGPPVKFTPPTVANGKVYVATTTGLSVFGLLPTS